MITLPIALAGQASGLRFIPNHAIRRAVIGSSQAVSTNPVLAKCTSPILPADEEFFTEGVRACV